jgi:hypothetical protein
MHRMRSFRPDPVAVVRATSPARPASRPVPRRWRRRGRRAQVAPVATILGLLLVVTFIANYISTTLPSQMSVNDVSHGTTVENQLGKLYALLAAVSGTGEVGAQVSQPISLGTDPAPPFAGADSSVLSQGNLTGRLTVNFTVLQPGGTTRAIGNFGVSGASLLVHLLNTYSPVADVAFDQGAVIYAQPGGQPILVDTPSITFANGALSVWVPSFQGPAVAESGKGTGEVYARLLSSAPLTYPISGYSLASGSHVTITVVTPYPTAWVGYFNSIASLQGLATCTGVRNVCTAAYQSSGPDATITLSIASVTSLSVDYAQFSLALA